MPARPHRLHNRVFSLVRRLYRGSAGLTSKNALKLALDVLEASGIAEMTVRDRHGFAVTLPTGDKVVAAGVLRKGHFDGEVVEALADAVRGHGLDPGALLFVSAGANIGTSCLNAYALGFRRMLAVEPDPDNFRLLERNLGQLEGAQARLLNVAVGESPGTALLHRHRSNFGGHSLQPLSRRQAAGGHEVEVLPLTAILDGDEPFALVLDVEGFEPEVIRGARDLLIARCRVLCVELAPSRYSEEGKRALADFARAFAPSYLHEPTSEWRPTDGLLDAMNAERKDYVDVIMVNRAPPPR